MELNRAARFDDEMRRLAEAADADVVLRLRERAEVERFCDTGCSERATRTVVISSPDKKATVDIYVCDGHYLAASSDRMNAKHGLEVKHEFRDEKLGGNPDKIRRLEPAITSPKLKWQTIHLVEHRPEPIVRAIREEGRRPEL